MTRFFIPTGQLRDVVLLTGFKTKPTGLVDHIRERPGVLQARARITAITPGSRLQWANAGTASTHTVELRSPEKLFINTENWLYRFTHHGGAWCRITAVQELDYRGEWVKLIVREGEIADDRQEPAEVAPIVERLPDPKVQQLPMGGPRYDF